MDNARVIWIGATGMRLEGMEPVDPAGLRFRLTQWQMAFQERAP